MAGFDQRPVAQFHNEIEFPLRGSSQNPLSRLRAAPSPLGSVLHCALPRRRPVYTVFSAHLLTRLSTNHIVYDRVCASVHPQAAQRTVWCNALLGD